MADQDLTEAAFLDNVVELAWILGWRVAHFRPAQTKHGWRTPMTGDPGFPDLVLARGGTVIFAELKSTTGRLRLGQDEWLAEIGPQAFLWRPDDIDAIKEVLSGS